jgi:hypothetical protein
MQKVRREKNLICEPIEILLRSLEDFATVQTGQRAQYLG